MSVQVSYKKQFVTGILILIIIVAAVEGSVRIFEIYNPPCGFINNPVFENEVFLSVSLICLDSTNLLYDQETVLRLVPNQHYTTININSDGFRGPDITINKPDETYRIMLLGGSSAFGMGSTSDETTISGFLQKKFEDNNINNIQIINAGVGGTISYEEKYYAENFLMRFNPDLFLIYDGGNDVRYRIQSPNDLINKSNFDKGFKFGDYPFYRTPFVVTKLINQYAIHDNIPKESEKITEDVKNTIVNNWKTTWSEFCINNNKKGIDTVIFLQPIAGTSNRILSAEESKIMLRDDVSSELDMLERMKHHLNELTQVCTGAFDLRQTFDNVNKPIFYDQIHVSDHGNMLIADKIYEKIIDLKTITR